MGIRSDMVRNRSHLFHLCGIYAAFGVFGWVAFLG